MQWDSMHRAKDQVFQSPVEPVVTRRLFQARGTDAYGLRGMKVVPEDARLQRWKDMCRSVCTCILLYLCPLRVQHESKSMGRQLV
jgi:hypothetical protein